MTTSVLPRIHSMERSRRTSPQAVSSSRVKETIAALAHGVLVGAVGNSRLNVQEVSVLFDADGRIWVDIGTVGHVSLEPPLGATIPFRLWVHTHPWDPTGAKPTRTH